MKLNKPLFLNIAFGVLIAAACLFLSQQGLLKRLELSTLDLFFRLRGNIAFNQKIVIVEITDADIAKVGRWPWERSWHAAMAKALTELGAKVVYFDFILSEGASEQGDAVFEEAIKQTKNVYLPFVFQDAAAVDIKNTLQPLERFSKNLKGTGAINIYADLDGIVRRTPLLFKAGRELYPHADLKIPLDYLNLKIKGVTPRQLQLANAKGTTTIPLVENNTLLINWSGKWKHTFKHYGFLQILAGYKNLLDNKEPKINLNDFKDSICLVAVTSIGLYDIEATPLEPNYPGIGIFATTISNILNRQFLVCPPGWINILLLFLLTLTPSFLIIGKKPLRETGLVLSALGIYFLLVLLSFRMGLVLDFAVPAFALFLTFFTVGTYNFFRVAIERQNFLKMAITDGMTSLYNIRYFRMLVETEIMMAKSDPTKMFTIVMSDVDHFKKFNDTYGHQVGDLVLKEVANSLKASVRYSDIVARYGGEEMIILLRGTPLKDGLIVAEKIRKNVESVLVKDTRNSYNVTISLGVSTFKRLDNVDTVIKRADDGLYNAKQSGRNRVMSTEENPPATEA